MFKLLGYVLVFISCLNNLYSQNPLEHVLKGKIIANSKDLDGVYILNLKTEKVSITTSGGYFSVPATVGDSLMFSAVQFKGKRICVTQPDLDKELFFVKMETMLNVLQEVSVVSYKNINAISLGIVSKDIKSYTPAERKLKTAGALDPIGNTDGTSGGSVSVDPFFNWLSGRTTLLKKELAIEQNETALSQIDDLYSNDIFVKLQIPEDHIKGFKFYLVENSEFIRNLKAKNRTMARFLMGELAAKYKQLLVDEQKK